jgi:hypothetical protein
MASWTDENNFERARLFRLLDGLEEAALQKKLPNGWSIADVLAHLAFWDRYALVALRQWQREGFQMPHENWAVINEIVDSMSRLIPPQALLAWVRDSASLCDQCVEETPAALAQELKTAGKSNFLFRAEHRRHHLNQIEGLL